MKIENCWICEGWIECNFEINLIEFMSEHNYDSHFTMDDDNIYNVYIHFDFDNYDADKLENLRD